MFQNVYRKLKEEKLVDLAMCQDITLANIIL